MGSLGRRYELRTGRVLEGDMDNVIRLFPTQTKFQEFKHELLDNANDYKDNEDPVLANMWKVRRVVGQFLHYWPVTEQWTDDMASAGLEALSEFENWDDEKALWNRIRHCIEVEVNNLRSIVGASFSTNRNRSSKGEPLEYGETTSLHNLGANDDELRMFELADSLTDEDYERYLECRND